jgi:hypothetical protein
VFVGLLWPSASAAGESHAPAVGEPAEERRSGHWREREIGPLSVAIPAEFDVVGLAVGLRPALLYRPVRQAPFFTLRASLGLLPGPEYFYLPVGLGLRGVLVPKARAHPYLGAGAELQTFFVGDHKPFVRSAVYVEIGLRVDVNDLIGIFLELAPEFGFAPLQGFGLSVRAGVQLSLPRPAWDGGS